MIIKIGVFLINEPEGLKRLEFNKTAGRQITRKERRRKPIPRKE